MAIFEGSNFDDTVTGDYALMDGGLGNDVLSSTHVGAVKLLGGTDFDFVFIDYINSPNTFGVIYGGPGNDVVYGGALKDELIGHTGDDYVVAHGSGTLLRGARGSDALVAGDGALDLVMQGGQGDDQGTITVRDQNRQPFTVEAGLYGSPGNDDLYGGTGDDLLVGGLGRDNLWGGPGKDIFRFAASEDTLPGSSHRDTIKDFSLSENDRIDLTRIDADEGLPGVQTFEFIGSHAFGDHAGELRFKNGVVQGDTNGDGIADFEIKANLIDSGRLGQHDFADPTGSDGNDDFIGGGGDDRFHGRGGDDGLIGGGGDDTLAGGDGNDYLAGGAGKDILRGGAGNDGLDGGEDGDKLTGGDGNDIFGFGTNNGHDKITDFQQGFDHISFEEALIDFSDLDITYKAHEAIIRAPGGKIVLTHFDGTLGESDFVF